MSRPRSAAQRASPLGCGPVRDTALLRVLALAACCSSDPELPPPKPALRPCCWTAPSAPPSTARSAEPRPDELRYIAVLTDLSSSCRYYSDDSGQGVDVDLSFKLIAERGPALSGSEEVTYFVATVGPGNQIFSRDVLSGDLPFAGDEERVGLSEDLTLRLPSITACPGRGLHVVRRFSAGRRGNWNAAQQPTLR